MVLEARDLPFVSTLAGCDSSHSVSGRRSTWPEDYLCLVAVLDLLYMHATVARVGGSGVLRAIKGHAQAGLVVAGIRAEAVECRRWLTCGSRLSFLGSWEGVSNRFSTGPKVHF